MSEFAARVAALRSRRGTADEAVWRWDLAWALVDLLAETEDLEPEDVRELLEHADWLLARDRDAGALQLAGLARSCSFALTHDPADGAHATGYLEEALTLLPPGDDGRAELLYQLAIEYLTQEGEHPAPGPLGRIIACLEELLDVQDEPEVRARLGLALGFRAATDPAYAAETGRAAELMTSAHGQIEDEGLRIDLSRNLASLHEARGDVAAAADWARRTIAEPAVAGTPLEARAHGFIAELLLRGFAPPGELDLGAALRFAQSADLAANLDRITEARRHLARAAELTPQDQDIAALLSMVTLAESGLNGGSSSGTTAAVRAAADRLPAGDPRRAQLSSLSAVLQEESDPVLGAGPELDARIAELRGVLADLPDGHMLRPWLLSRLGASVGQRAGALGAKADCAEAVELLVAALAGMPEGDPLRARTFVFLSGAVLTALRVDPMGADLDRILTDLPAVVNPAVPAPGLDAAAAHVVFGSAYVARAARDSSGADYDRGIEHLRVAVDAYGRENPLRVPLLFIAATAMTDRYGTTRDLALLDAAGHYLDEVDVVLAASGAPEYAPGTLDRRAVWLLRVMVRFGQYLQRQDPVTADRLLADLERIVALTPAGHPDLRLVHSLRAWAHGVRALHSGDPRAMSGALDQLMAAGAGVTTDDLYGRALRGQAGLAAVTKGLTAGDRHLLDQGIQTLTEVVAAPDTYLGETGAHRYVLGSALIQRHRTGGRPDDLDRGIAHLEAVIRDRATGPLDGVYPILLVDLAQAYRLKGDPRAVDTGLRALRERLADVLLQTGAERGLAMSKAVRDDALETMGWALADGWPEAAVEALELGRAMVLHAATAADALPALLHARGRDALALEWETHLATETAASPWESAAVELGPEGRVRISGLMIPGDLRHRVLAAIEGTPLAELLTPPTPAEIARALRGAGRHALVYLLPRGEFCPGLALIVRPDVTVTTTVLPGLDVGRGSRLDRYQRAQNELVSGVELGELRWRHALEELCDWAGEAALTTILAEIGEPEPSIVLVPAGTLGIVPWHAAYVPATLGSRDGQVRACQRATISYAASARQFAAAAERQWSPPGQAPVLISNPDLAWAIWECAQLFGHRYPAARRLGKWLGGDEVPAASAEAVLGVATGGYSVLHFAGHATSSVVSADSALVVADGEKLPVQRLLGRAGKGGGLVVLSACTSDLSDGDHDEALTLATAFQATGARGVVGSRWAIGDDVRTAVMMLMFHRFLSEAEPGAALARTQRWMLDPGRRIPEDLRGDLADVLGELDFADPAIWAAFTHQGVS
ncbi:CHAT domain-containing protein [Acrocarpospora phusangensis]|uniref:CHAT domain-containing protein n=1 Tax=Acrocarpospora phusangensis TaxID=1070424 RepID=UPI0019512456|nr:CHAT domain-containing protein [Acrocarpospora phusangensis]